MPDLKDFKLGETYTVVITIGTWKGKAKGNWHVQKKIRQNN